MSSIYKDGKYWKIKLDDGRRFYLGTIPNIIKCIRRGRKAMKVQKEIGREINRLSKLV